MTRKSEEMKKVINLPYSSLSPDFPEKFWISYANDKYPKRENIRFDFLDEWNNLGYGKITNDKSKWSISNSELGESEFSEVLAYVESDEGKKLCVFIGIKEVGNEVHFVVNREAGLSDSTDFSLIEDFLVNYNKEKFGSVPVLSEIPYGFKSAVTMRIDCDEDIKSGRELFLLYKEMNVPFSMAIKTSLDLTGENKSFMLEVIEGGGSVVTHSNSHAENWGGSEERAYEEATLSRNKLMKALDNSKYNYDYVVSPFHQNPQYAVKGLERAGIKGFVGGIIKNDPEYLSSRAGYVSTKENIITHSQQCMLHGDCYKETGLKVYKKSFDNHYKSNTFFGFLDHPFSDYWYGWESEEQRLEAHRDFLKYLKSNEGVWFANLIDAMNFLWVKSNTKIWIENEELKWELPKFNFKTPDLKVYWQGKEWKIPT